MSINFIDVNSNKVLISDVSNAWSLKAKIERDSITENMNTGTLINAANLNAAFASKQNKLTAGVGIAISSDNKISCTLPDYSPLAIKLDGEYSVNYRQWKALRSYTTLAYGRMYLATIMNNNFKFADADVSFSVRDIIYDVNIDADPTIVIKFEDSSDNRNSVYCAFGFVKSRIRLIKGEGWTPMRVKNNILYPNTNGYYAPIDVRIIRRMTESGLYSYEFFLNGGFLAAFTETDAAKAVNYNVIKIGTIGCKADLSNWQASGTY